MRCLGCQLLCSILAPRPTLTLMPDWKIGAGQSDGTRRLELRQALWRNLHHACAIRWLDKLRIYIYPGNESSRSVFLTGFLDPNEFFWLAKVLRPGMKFIDAGANMGLYTIFAGRRIGPRGAVVAIEPSERDFSRLAAHVALNRLTNVTPIQLALSDHAGDAELLVAGEEHSGHNTLGGFGYDSVPLWRKERVRVNRLDDVVADLGLCQVDIIKMDIEGAELGALRGAAHLLAECRPALLLELSDRTLRHQGSHSGQIWDFLTERGYALYAFDPKTALPAPAVRRAYFDSENIIAVHTAKNGML